MPSLSVIMIVKNEERRLPDCLASVRSIADEIVIGDTGSTDGTVAVAERFGARVLRVEWRDDFAYARNRVLEAARGDWMLHLDADEALDPDGARRIREIVDADGEGADAIWLTLANYTNDHRSWRWVPADPGDPYARGYAGYLKTELTRLFRKMPGVEYREIVHENIGQSLEEAGARQRSEPILIHHYGFADGSARSVEKGKYYLELAREKARKSPEFVKSWFDLAAVALQFGELETAEAAAKRALEIDPGYHDAVYVLTYLYLGRGDYDQAKALIEERLLAGETPVLFVGVLGAIATREGRYDRALKLFQLALDADPKHVLCRLLLARAHDQLGRPAETRRCLQRALEIAPALAEVRNRTRAFDLRMEGEALFAGNNVIGALRHFVQALELDPEDPVLHNDIGVALHALGERADAKRAFDRALRLAPCLAPALDNLRAAAND